MKTFLKIFISILLSAVLIFLTMVTFYLPKYIQSDAKVNLNAEDDGSITLMSTNVRYVSYEDFFKRSWFYRADLVCDDINSVQPDIIGFQEATPIHYEYLKKILVGYDNEMAYRDNFILSEGCPIFYRTDKFEKVDSGSFWLSETPEKPSMGWDAACKRTATWALMKDKKTGKQFYFVNTHLDHRGSEAQRKGLELIVSRISHINPKGYPMVLTGDFNVKPNNDALKDLDTKMMSARKIAPRTDNHPTFNNWGKIKPDMVIDYIYVSGFAACPEYHTVTEKYGSWKYVSDHYPIAAKLIF